MGFLFSVLRLYHGIDKELFRHFHVRRRAITFSVGRCQGGQRFCVVRRPLNIVLLWFLFRGIFRFRNCIHVFTNMAVGIFQNRITRVFLILPFQAGRFVGVSYLVAWVSFNGVVRSIARFELGGVVNSRYVRRQTFCLRSVVLRGSRVVLSVLSSLR